MRVRILGPVAVETGRGGVALAAAKERAVLARLAVDVGRPVPIGSLVDALWGDDPPSSAVKTAQSYVARLRRALPPEWITSTGNAYTLNLAPAEVDAGAFEIALAEARVAAELGNERVAVDRLAEGLALWRDRALPDVAHSASGGAIAVRLEDLRLTAEEDLAELRLALGDDPAVADLTAAAQAEPFRERRWVHLITALYRANRQGDALRAYQHARAALVDELGVEPGEALQAAERAVLDRDDSLLAPAATKRSHRLPAALEAITTSALAGRRDDLALLLERWHEVGGGETRAVLVGGEPGIGKTRLVAEVAVEAHRDGALVLFGRCDRERLTPYQAVVDAFRDLDVAWTIPELAGVRTRRADDEVDRDGRQRLFDAVAALLDGCAARGPIVLVVDDLQWADAETFGLIRHLLRAVQAPLLLLATHRSGSEEDSDAALVVAELPAAARPYALELSGLDLDGVAALIGDNREVATRVLESTGGSPLFIVELLRFRDTVGHFPEGDDVPVGLRQAVARRIAELPAHSRRFLDAAAVAGSEIAVDEVATVAALTEPDAIDIVDRAIAGHILADHGPDGVVFSHDLVRSALLHDMSSARRAYLHRRVAETILAATRDDPRSRAASVAHHLAASRTASATEVVRWALVAADEALSRYAWETAATHLTLALDHVGVDVTVERVELLTRVADALRTAGNESIARERFTEAVECARQLPDPTIHRSVVIRRTNVPVDIRTELDQVIGVLRDAIDTTPDDGSPDRAQLLSRLAFSLGWAGDPTARSVADRALDIARGAGEATTLARALMRAMPTREQFEAYDPDGILGELASLAPLVVDPDLRGQMLSASIVGALQRGNRAAATEALAELHVLADRHHFVNMDFYARRWDGYVALGESDHDGADRVAGELLAQAMRTDLPNLFLAASSLLYDVRRAQGRLDELLPWFERRRDTGERIPKVAAMRAEVLAAAGRADDAAAALAELQADRFGLLTPSERPHSIATLADVAVTLHLAPVAAELADILRPWSGLVVIDSSNGPLEPVDDYLTRLDAVAGTASDSQ